MSRLDHVDRKGFNVVSSIAFADSLRTAGQDPQKAARALDIERKAAHRRLALAMKVADDLERDMGIDTRWEKTDEPYNNALHRLQHREFIRTVNRLEGLVVQRLFELSKANLAATGKDIYRFPFFF
jgi:hypothetical protein